MDDQSKKTINEKEIEILKFWEDNSIFEKTVSTPAGNEPKGSFSFYDGPPFATGLPHHGSLMAGTVKDVIPRFQTMKGNSVRRVWGWDCHGLPIENMIEKKLNLSSKKDIEEYGIEKFNKEAADSVLQYESEWKNIIPRVGRFVDMDHPYKTMDATYTESIWWAWKELMNKGLAYEGNKMMHICPRCETPLAQSEVGLEYHDVTDLSVTAKFELLDESGTFILAWTTTPWTLPGNTALAVNNGILYAKVKAVIDGVEGNFILAKSKLEEYFKDGEVKEIIEEFTGDKLVGKKYKPVFPYFVDKEIENKENIWQVWHADFITEVTGTGIAHEAPAFGAEDMDLAKQNNIPIIKHVKMDGTFTSEVVDFAGMKVKQKDDTQSTDIEIIKWLAHNGKLFEKHKIIHSYPLCWRCKTPLLNYATSSWFIDVPKMKDKLIAENKKIGWTPEHIRDGRFGKWLEGAREWAVSRSRYWGAPLPIWKNSDGSKLHVIGSLNELSELNPQKPNNNYYIMRHGESESNVNGVIDCDGISTNHLTENGKDQVVKSAKLIEDKIDLIVTSPFVRTIETGKILSDEFGVIEQIVDVRLKEFNLGIFDGKDINEYREKYKDVNIDTRVEGGETHRELMQRTLSAWMDLEKNFKGKNIVIVTHGATGWILEQALSLATDTDINKEMDAHGPGYWLPNAVPKKIYPKMVPRDETGAVNLHRPYIDEIKLEIDGEEYTRIQDVFDCWYESGSMPFASLHYPFENKDIFEKNFPADFIAESMDQTRGWFYSLINLGVGLFDKAPYRHVIVNGIINAADGQKISKSEKNYTDPMLLVEKYGADAFRYYLMNSPVTKGESINFKDEDLEEVYKKIILRLENVLSLYLMNAPEKVVLNSDSDDVLNKWIVARLHETLIKTTKGYEDYNLEEAVKPIDQFVDDLSVWYVRRARSRMKGEEGEEIKNITYGTLAYILRTYALITAPVMPFISERIYKAINGERESVHLEEWPQTKQLLNDDYKKIIDDMVKAREVVSLALTERNKHGISVKQPLQSLTTSIEIGKEYYSIICDEVNVKEIIIEKSDGINFVRLDTDLNEDLIKEGDIRILTRAVQDARKDKNLSPKDTINMLTDYLIPESLKTSFMNTCNIQSIEKGSGDYKAALSSGNVSFGINII